MHDIVGVSLCKNHDYAGHHCLLDDIPYSRVVKRIFAVRFWFDPVIKIFFIKCTFIDMVPSNDTLESKRKLLFRLISGTRTVCTSNKAHSNLIFVIKRTSLLGAPRY